MNKRKIKNVKRLRTAYIIIAACLFLLPCYVVSGQQIKSKSVEPDDILSLLRNSGYELFSFDITDMLKKRYDIVMVLKEHSEDGDVSSKTMGVMGNKKLMTDFPESQWQKIIDAGIIIDAETKAIAHAEKITFGFYPSKNDTTASVHINIPEFTTMYRTLKLRGLPKKDSDKKFFKYYTRPFIINSFQEDTFIPLILLGSMWYDEKSERYGFCGEKEIDPNMSSEILKRVPHYYVFGLIFRKSEQ